MGTGPPSIHAIVSLHGRVLAESGSAYNRLRLPAPLAFPVVSPRWRGQGEGIYASRPARIPVRNTPSNVPAPPIESTGAPISVTRPRFIRSAPISVPIVPAT
jgi:hypothetical protein